MGGDFPMIRLTAEAKAQAYVVDESIYESRQTASPNPVTYMIACIVRIHDSLHILHIYEYFVNQTTKKKNDVTLHGTPITFS